MHEWVENLKLVQDKDVRLARLQAQIVAVPGEKEKAKATMSELPSQRRKSVPVSSKKKLSRLSEAGQRHAAVFPEPTGSRARTEICHSGARARRTVAARNP
jgi:hypothetical protein